jgi:hypothetical protein
MITQLLAVIVDARQTVNEQLERLYDLKELLVAQRGPVETFPVGFNIVIAASTWRNQSRLDQTVSREFQGELNGMTCVVENRKHERVTLLVHFLVDYGTRKLNRGLDVAVDIMLLIALLPNAGIPSAVRISLEERIVTVRVCPGLGRNSGLGR